MNNYIALLALFFCVSCTASRYMNYEEYHKVAIGEKISEVQVQLGRPYEVQELGHNRQEYIYIERITLGEKRELFRRYIFTVDHEKVVEKRVKEEVTSSIEFYGP